VNISALFIKRPVATILLTVGFPIAGMIAFMLLPVASLPLVDLSAISVTATLPGASPENMASLRSDSARKAVQPYRRHYRDEFDEHTRCDVDQAGLRYEQRRGWGGP
jgi:AcrB/AcrD/AcrF family